MKILVTGGSGFIGSAVVSALCRRGENVRALVRSSERLGNLAGLDVEVVQGDLMDRESLARAVEGCDQVYHLAAVYANWLPDPKVIHQVNVQGTRYLLQACLDAGTPRVVYTSSVAALGAHGKQPGDESAQFNLQAIRDPYYLSKWDAEHLVLEFISRGLPMMTVYPTNPIGPRDIKPTPNGALIISILKHRLPGYVDGGINIVDVDDVAQGHLSAMAKGKPGEKYILGNQNLSIKEYFQMIGEIGAVRAPSMRVPLSVAVTMGYLYELRAAISHKSPSTTANWVRIGSHYSFWDSSKAIRELEFPQTPVRESLRRAIEWFRHKGYA